MKEKLKEKRWKLIWGLLLIPITFWLIITCVGIGINVFKYNIFHFGLVNSWHLAMKTPYVLLATSSISVLTYFYYMYKILKTKVTEATLRQTKQDKYGQAQWLSPKELDKKYPLVNPSLEHEHHGFVINSKFIRKTLMFNMRTNTHNLIIGGTGTGKTQGLVLPTIQANSKSKINPSMIITDPKGEIYQTQRINLQNQGYKVKVVNLRNVSESISWNPLAGIYEQFKLMLLSSDEQQKLHLKVQIQSDIQDLTKTLFVRKNIDDPFWSESGVLITEAIILAMLEDVEIKIDQEKTVDKNKIEITLNQLLPLNKFNLSSVAVIATMRYEMIDWFKQRQETSIAKITANQILVGESKTLTSILMTMSTHLAIFKNEFIRNITCKNDLDFNSLIDNPTALFIIVPDENHNYYSFISLLITQVYKFLVSQTIKNGDQKLERPVYFLCDEFGNIPAIPNMENIITIARSRNIFFQLIVQDLEQLKTKYGTDIANIIFNNCSLHVFLHTNHTETAERYSKMIGDATVLQINYSGKGKSKSQSESLKGHPLIIPSDLTNLPGNQAIVLYTKENPIKVMLIPWYQMDFAKGKQELISKPFNLINFEKDYYYDIKTKINKKVVNDETKSKIPNINSKKQLEEKIRQLKTQLKLYENKNSLHHQELKLAIKRQIEYLEKIKKDVK